MVDIVSGKEERKLKRIMQVDLFKDWRIVLV